jgi:hypothetical protein
MGSAHSIQVGRSRSSLYLKLQYEWQLVAKSLNSFTIQLILMAQHLAGFEEEQWKWNEGPYKVGFWPNWSKGGAAALTLTVPSNPSKVLLALIALFVSIVEGHAWSKSSALVFDKTPMAQTSLASSLISSAPLPRLKMACIINDKRFCGTPGLQRQPFGT